MMGARHVRERMSAGRNVMGWRVRLACEGRNEALERLWGFQEMPREWGVGIQCGR